MHSRARVELNFRDASLEEVVEGVGRATGKNFVIDPQIGTDRRFTLIGFRPVSEEGLYQAFLSMLGAHGIVAVPSGPVIKLSPDRTLRIYADVPEGALQNDELETRVLAIDNVQAQTLVPILRPLLSPRRAPGRPCANQRGHSLRPRLQPEPGRPGWSSASTSGTTSRSRSYLLNTPVPGTLVRVLNEIVQASEEGGSNVAVADDRTNSILLGGEENRRLELRAIIAHLDTPLEEGGNTRVRYLNYASAENLAGKLSTQFSDEGTTEIKVKVAADEETNALIIDAPPDTLRRMLAVVDQLDIRRAQVLVEVLIAEVSADRANQLGVNWAAYDPQRVLGSTDFPASGTSLRELVAGSLSNTDQGRAAAGQALGPGAGFAVGRVRDDGLSFAALISAVENTAGANILGTPMLVTLDNQPAEFNVGQQVPFITGSYASSGINPSSADGQIRPFTTVNRGSVGLNLKITPRINRGDAVRLEINQQLSELAPSVAGAVDLVTNERTLNTAVIVEDGGTLVLGGLIQEKVRESRQSVPLLGRLPLIGALFRASGETLEKTNLMLFIRPTILRDSAQAEAVTNAKYNYLRRQQLVQAYSGKGPRLPDALDEAFEPGSEASGSKGEELAEQPQETPAPD